MPELPEVESLRKSLIPFVENQKILKVEVLLAKLVSARGTTRISSDTKSKEFIEGLTNRTIKSIDRRAKNLIFKFDDDSILLVHLKMTGQLIYHGHKKNDSHDITVWGGHPIQESDSNLPNKHTYVIFFLENGTLYYNDVRQFGYLLYYKDSVEFEKENHFDGLGMEPFSIEFTYDNFRTNLKKRTGQLKKVFLDQKVVVGLGNIYADEVCFEAKVLPTRLTKSLKDTEIMALYNAIKRILPLAVSLGGSSIANYLLGDGSRGNYAREHKVYGRAGKECVVCGSLLEKMQSAGRTTVFCKVCQK